MSCSSKHSGLWDPPLFHFAGPSDILEGRSVERSTEGSEYECKDGLIYGLSDGEDQKRTYETVQAKHTFDGRAPSGFPSALRRDKSVRVLRKTKNEC